MDRNKVTVDIFGLRTVGLVDTGAAISCISQNIISRLQNKNLKIENTNNMNICGVGGEEHRVKGKVNLPVKFKGLIVKYAFYVIENLQYPLILGDDFLLDNKCNIHYPSRTLHIHEGAWQVALITTTAGKAKTTKRLTIPAKSIAEIPVLIPEQFINDYIILEPVPFLADYDHEILGASCLVRATKSSTRMQIINPNDRPVTIPKYTKIATVSLVNEKSIQDINDDKYEEKENKQVIGNINKKKGNKSKLEFDLTSSDISEDQKCQLLKFLNKNRDVFAADLSELGKCNVGEHDIETEDHRPFRIPPYRTSPDIKEEIERQVEKMKEQNIVVPSTSPYNSPVVLCKKKDGTFRFAIDYRKLNKITKPMSYPLPNLNDVFDAIGNAKANTFSVLDLCQGFWQIPLNSQAREKCAFVTHSGVYEWTRMPFGLRNSSITFSRVLGQVLQGLNWKNVLAYVDDILIFSKNFEEHLHHLSQVFGRLKNADLKLKPSKCQFAVKEVKYLGHVLTKDGVKVDEDKVKIVKNYPTPKNQTEVRQLIGLTNYYRKFVRNYAKICVPLNKLLQKESPFEWTQQCQDAFETLKDALTSAPILAFPDMSKPFELITDASGHSLGYLLCQKDSQNRECVISYGERALKREEKRWTVSEKECLAVLEGIKNNKVYLSHSKFTVVTDHKALVWLHKIKDTNAKLGRWALQLQNYTFDVIYREGKNNQNADALSRIPYPPTPDNPVEEEDFPSALVQNIETLEEGKQDEVQNMSTETVGKNMKIITEITFEYDEPKQMVATIDDKEIPLDNIEQVVKLQKKCPELSDLIIYLNENKLPNDDKKARAILFEKDAYRLGSKGELIHLYWPRTKGMPRAEAMIEQLVLPKILRQDALLSYHDCTAGGGHKGFRRTYAAIQLKYYWNGLYQNVHDYVMSCDKCQRAKCQKHKHPAPLQPLPIENTFDRWHMDILTGLPKSKEGYQHILLIVDSFSRWSEALPLKTQEAREVAECLYNDIFTRFGAPKTLVSDRGQNFLSKLIQAVCELFNVTRHHTSSYHPQSNSTCERMNSTIAQTLRTYCGNENWPKLLPSVMMAMRMTPNTESTGFSPFKMIFGKEMNIPFDVAMQPKDNIGKSAQEHVNELIDQLKMVQKIAKCNVDKAQEKGKTYYDKKARKPQFKVGDRVLLQCMKVPKGTSPKLQMKWEGPFYIHHANDTTYKLRRLNDHKILKSRIHANRLKLYNDPRDHRVPPTHVQQQIDNDNNIRNIDDKVANDETQIDITDNESLTDETNDETDNEQVDDNDQFLADKLLAKKKINGKTHYRVKWVGYSKTTWVPEEDIGEGLLIEYHNKYTQTGKVRKKIKSCFKRK